MHVKSFQSKQCHKMRAWAVRILDARKERLSCPEGESPTPKWEHARTSPPKHAPGHAYPGGYGKPAALSAIASLAALGVYGWK